MTITSTPTAAAPRTRTLVTQRSPFALPTDALPTDVWGTRVSVHNYIRPMLADSAVRGGLGAAKQAAPPRGVPR